MKMYGSYMCLMCGKYYESPKILGYFAHAQTVSTRPLFGWEGPGDKVKQHSHPTTGLRGNYAILNLPILNLKYWVFQNF